MQAHKMELWQQVLVAEDKAPNAAELLRGPLLATWEGQQKVLCKVLSCKGFPDDEQDCCVLQPGSSFWKPNKIAGPGFQRGAVHTFGSLRSER